jgi:hypothetical protein
MFDTKQIQKALRARGFMGKDGKPLTVDGEGGPNTNHAIMAFKRSVGLRARAFVGPITYAMLMADGTAIKKAIPAGDDPTWFNEMLLMIGKHERRENAELSAWLRSDGATVGDPSKIPWCGDGVQTWVSMRGKVRQTSMFLVATNRTASRSPLYRKSVCAKMVRGGRSVVGSHLDALYK